MCVKENQSTISWYNFVTSSVIVIAIAA